MCERTSQGSWIIRVILQLSRSNVVKIHHLFGSVAGQDVRDRTTYCPGKGAWQVFVGTYTYLLGKT